MSEGAASGEKHVLIITYAFPPAALVGVHRTLKYCRYLGDHGWAPVVLTARTAGVNFTDANLLRQLPSHIEVHRTFDIDPAKWEERLAERKMRRQALVAPAGRAEATAAKSPESNGEIGFLGRFKRTLKTLLKDSPDSHLFWVPFALLRGVWILCTRPIDVIYCSTPPHSSHIAAFLLAKVSGKPYVLDFRDPWYVSGSARTPSGKLPSLLKMETWFKRTVVRSAAHVVCVSRGECDEMRAEFPEVATGRFSFITNGYDPADTAEARPNASSIGKLVMIHAGTVYPGVAGRFFDALETQVATEPDLHAKLEVRLLGEIASEYADVVGRLERSGVIKVYGSIPHAEALRMLRESDVLVILMGGGAFRASHIPAKTFEYLQAERPILAIAGDGEMAEIVTRSGLGIVVAPDSIEEIARKVRDLCAARQTGALERSPDRAYICTFERPKLAEQLAGVLDGVIGAGGVKGRRT